MKHETELFYPKDSKAKSINRRGFLVTKPLSFYLFFVFFLLLCFPLSCFHSLVPAHPPLMWYNGTLLCMMDVFTHNGDARKKGWRRGSGRSGAGRDTECQQEHKEQCGTGARSERKIVEGWEVPTRRAHVAGCGRDRRVRQANSVGTRVESRGRRIS